MWDDRIQLETLNRSLNAAQAECDTLKEVLATQAADLSSLREQLSSANTSNITMRNTQMQLGQLNISRNKAKAERDGLKVFQQIAAGVAGDLVEDVAGALRGARRRREVEDRLGDVGR